MTPNDQQRFWTLYEKQALPVIERACRRTSRTMSDGRLDADDMAAWVHTRVWRLLEGARWPTFHDDPTPEVAIERLTQHAHTLARWAYLAQMRTHVRHIKARQAYADRLSQAERLSLVSAGQHRFEQTEATRADLDRVRSALSDSVRSRLAASWPDSSERLRVGVLLEATNTADDELIEKTMNNEIPDNTLDQWRSRARKAARSQLGTRLGLFALVAVLVTGVGSARAFAEGEQTGGRGGKGLRTTDSSLTLPDATVARGDGEQSGGRGG